MASFRHLARIAVMQTIFAYEFRKGKPEEVLKEVLKNYSEKIQDPAFALGILRGAIKHKRKIRSVIEKHAPEWPFEKIAPVDRAILEVGVFEILYSEDVPPVVAINEAIEISKSYGDRNSSKFINGVLSSVMNEYCKGRDIKAPKAPKKTKK